MNYLLIALGLFAISSLSFAEEISEAGQEVLKKIRALKDEEKKLLATITDETQKDLVEEALDKQEETEDKTAIETLEKEQKQEEEEEHTREKRAAHKGKKRHPKRKARRSRKLVAHKKRAHAARHRANLRRARRNHRIKKIRALQKRRG